jgi:YegS/Rv2252/BmrU family lipid kinase
MRLIVNPVAGCGRAAALCPQLQDELCRLGADFDVVMTEGPHHAVDLSRQAVADDCRVIVAVGGDGTMHEVVNGLAAQGEVPADLVLGMVCCGTGSDFARTVGLELEPIAAAGRLLHGVDRRIDLGVIQCWRDGQEIVEYFPNSAGLGFDGEVADRTNRMPKFIGGTVPYLLSLVITLVAYRNKQVVVTLDDRVLELRANFVVAANGRYFGGGMHIAPDATPDDGLFDVVIAGDVGKLELLKLVPSVYKGTHLSHPKASVYRSSAVHVESAERMVLQADGEYVGEAPVTFRLLPGALTVRV